MLSDILGGVSGGTRERGERGGGIREMSGVEDIAVFMSSPTVNVILQEMSVFR